MFYGIYDISLKEKGSAVTFRNEQGVVETVDVQKLLNLYVESKKDHLCASCNHRKTAHSCGNGVSCCDCNCTSFTSPTAAVAETTGNGTYDPVKFHLAKAYRAIEYRESSTECAKHIRKAWKGWVGGRNADKELREYGLENPGVLPNYPGRCPHGYSYTDGTVADGCPHCLKERTILMKLHDLYVAVFPADTQVKPLDISEFAVDLRKEWARRTNYSGFGSDIDTRIRSYKG